MIHICYGTQAELIKLAPILHELDRRGAPHRTISTAQHPAQTAALEREFDLRPPDVKLHHGPGVYTAARAAAWATKILAKCFFARRRMRREVFAPGPGVCVAHGDTLTTLLVAIITRRLRLKLAHVEAGLRSFRWRNPFPEELVRVFIDRRADLLFAPGAWARANLEKMRVRGRIVELPANTGKDTLDLVLSHGRGAPRDGPYAVASLHRFETVTSRRHIRKAADIVIRASRRLKVVWPMHQVFRARAAKAGVLERIAAADIETCDILGYSDFARLLDGAEFVIADGGSIQEESWFLDKPCLLLRRNTERREGLDENVLLSGWRDEDIDAFLADPSRWRRRTRPSEQSPSRLVVDELLAFEDGLDGS